MFIDIYKTRKRYTTIYADPPWKEQGGGQCKRGADRHYKLMSTEEICELPIRNITTAACHLYLWVTNNFLEDGLKVINAWGFRYVTTITWIKEGAPGLGQYYRGLTEHCLFAVRESLPYKLDEYGRRRQGVTGFTAPRGRHSEKPIEMRQMIERVSHMPALELFARESAPGWDYWGNDKSISKMGYDTFSNILHKSAREGICEIIDRMRTVDYEDSCDDFNVNIENGIYRVEQNGQNDYVTLSRYVADRFYRVCGFNVQPTYLGAYNQHLVTLCDISALDGFYSFKTVTDMYQMNINTDLSLNKIHEILNNIVYLGNINFSIEHVLLMCTMVRLIDTFLGDCTRSHDDWGFVIRADNGGTCTFGPLKNNHSVEYTAVPRAQVRKELIDWVGDSVYSGYINEYINNFPVEQIVAYATEGLVDSIRDYYTNLIYTKFDCIKQML